MALIPDISLSAISYDEIEKVLSQRVWARANYWWAREDRGVTEPREWGCLVRTVRDLPVRVLFLVI